VGYGCLGQRTHQFKNCDFHHTLVEVRWFVFDDLYGNDFVRLHVLTFYDLPKRSLTEDVQNQVPSGNFSQGEAGRNSLSFAYL